MDIGQELATTGNHQCLSLPSYAS